MAEVARPRTLPDAERFMRLALRLGRHGLGRTSPNPPVGAVVVRAGKVVGRGYHRRAGAPHAEVEALRRAGEKARGATLYVTLEPCSHFGRTPPCTDAVRAAGIRDVVVGCRDPNPRSGNGIAALRRAGVRVRTGVLEKECKRLIEAFRKSIRTGIPWVTLKLAATLDGRIASHSGESRWITGAPARYLVHRWRDAHDAVLVGCETVRHDDPSLTCRIPGGRDPLRVIMDGRLRVPLQARVFSPTAAAGTTVVTQRGAAPRRRRQLQKRGASVLELPGRGGLVSLRAALRALCRRGVHSVLIEGGGQVAAAAVREQVVDRFLLFYAPKLLGGDGRPMIHAMGFRSVSQATPLEVERVSRVGRDLLVEARLKAAPKASGRGRRA